MKKVLLFTLFFTLFFFSLYSQEKMRIAVMDLKDDGISRQTAKTVTNMIRTELINANKFAVIERGQMEKILTEQGIQQTGCTDQECAVQVGKLMSARKILIGEVAPMGNSIIMTVRIVLDEWGGGTA